jgi:hypothetical protein
MIKSSVDQIETAIKITRGAMAEAADAVIGTGVWIDTDVNITSYPDRYRDSTSDAGSIRLARKPVPERRRPERSASSLGAPNLHRMKLGQWRTPSAGFI